jgi:hypothetical protein
MLKSFRIRRCHPVNLQKHNKQNLKHVKEEIMIKKNYKTKREKKSKKIVLFYIYKGKRKKEKKCSKKK